MARGRSAANFIKDWTSFARKKNKAKKRERERERGGEPQTHRGKKIKKGSNKVFVSVLVWIKLMVKLKRCSILKNEQTQQSSGMIRSKKWERTKSIDRKKWKEITKDLHWSSQMDTRLKLPVNAVFIRKRHFEWKWSNFWNVNREREREEKMEVYAHTHFEIKLNSEGHLKSAAMDGRTDQWMGKTICNELNESYVPNDDRHGQSTIKLAVSLFWGSVCSFLFWLLF